MGRGGPLDRKHRPSLTIVVPPVESERERYLLEVAAAPQMKGHHQTDLDKVSLGHTLALVRGGLSLGHVTFTRADGVLRLDPTDPPSAALVLLFQDRDTLDLAWLETSPEKGERVIARLPMRRTGYYATRFHHRFECSACGDDDCGHSVLVQKALAQAKVPEGGMP